MTDEPRGTDRATGALRTIAGFKLLQALVLIAAGCGALGLLDGDRNDAVLDLLDGLSLHDGRRFVARSAASLYALLDAAEPRRLELIAIGSFAYAAVFATEAVGLWLRKRWAEYLTIVVTASFVPVEVMAIVEQRTPVRIVMLVVNLIVIGYLARNVIRERKKQADEEGREAVHAPS